MEYKTMNNLVIFRFQEELEVRTLERDGEPWFVAKDVCDILGLGNVTETLRNMPDDEVFALSSAEGKTIGFSHATAGVNLINEPGLYRLIFQSRKPEAEAFKRWVFHEVLPSIRKTGSYVMLKEEYDKLKLDYNSLGNVYQQNDNFRAKYLALLDKLDVIKPFWWKADGV
jgi:prophage antirepressor-like protein